VRRIGSGMILPPVLKSASALPSSHNPDTTNRRGFGLLHSFPAVTMRQRNTEARKNLDDSVQAGQEGRVAVAREEADYQNARRGRTCRIISPRTKTMAACALSPHPLVPVLGQMLKHFPWAGRIGR